MKRKKKNTNKLQITLTVYNVCNMSLLLNMSAQKRREIDNVASFILKFMA